MTRFPKGSGRSLPVAVAEGVVLLGGLALLDYLQIVDVTQMPVHPYVFVVALMSAQYGALGGIASAAAATILSFSEGVPVRPVGQDYFDFLLAAWSPSLAWVAIAVLIGLVADRHFRALEQTRANLVAADRERDLIAGQYDILAARTRRLERRHAGFAEPIPRPGQTSPKGRSRNGSDATVSENRAIN